MRHYSGVRRDTDTPEYPAALLDPRSCAKDVLRYIYAYIVPPALVLDRPARDAEIYQRYQHGASTVDLSKTYSLSVQRIRKIIRFSREQEG